MANFKTYYYLTKPGIIYGNLISATAGFLLASKGHIDFGLLLAVLAGTSLVIASACVFNNYIDRNIDGKMSRTKNRAFVKGKIPVKIGLIYGSLLVIAGFAILIPFTNWPTVIAGLIGWFIYVFVYSFAKHHTVYSTVIGSIPGAMPIVAGYVAVTDKFDQGALLLMVIMICWQMPHFYAISTRRLKEYKAADLPVLPVKKGVKNAKIRILLYIIAYIIATLLLYIKGYTGYVYLVGILAVGLYWLFLATKGFRTSDEINWAKQVFLFSLIALLIFSFLISINSWLV